MAVTARLTLLLFLLAALAAAPARAQLSEADIKAAYLLNFARFVQWPERSFSAPDAPFRVCVLGENPFNGALQGLNGKAVGTRVIQTTVLRSESDALQCHIVYIGATVEGRVTTTVGRLATLPVLTVASGEEFARRFGIISLVTRQGRVKVHVNVQRAEAAGLRLGAKLLEVAERRYPDTAVGGR